MKAFVAIAVLALVAVISAAPFTEEQIQRGQEHVKKCMSEHPITPEDVQRLKTGEYEGLGKNADCFTHCFMQAAGFVDANGDQQRDAIVQKLSVGKDRGEIEAVANNCKHNVGSSPCEKSLNSYKCYRSAIQF